MVNSHLVVACVMLILVSLVCTMLRSGCVLKVLVLGLCFFGRRFKLNITPILQEVFSTLMCCVTLASVPHIYIYIFSYRVICVQIQIRKHQEQGYKGKFINGK